MPGTLQLVTYRSSDLTKATALATQSLSDGSDFTLVSFVPLSSVIDLMTGEYPDVRENIILHAAGAAMDDIHDDFILLHQWQRKVQQSRIVRGVGEEVWLSWQPANASQVAYAKVKDLTAQPGTGRQIMLSLRREGLWWGDYSVVNIENTWNSAASTITIQNHMDELTNVYDAKWDAGYSYSSNKPTYLFAGATNAASGAASQANDRILFGCTDGEFDGFSLDIVTGACYAGSCAWQYFKTTPGASGFTNFTPTDGTSKLIATGVQTVTWDADDLTGWGAYSLNSVNAYWIQLKFTEAASCTRCCTVQDSDRKFGIYANYRSSHSNYIKVDSANVDGDAPATMQMMIQSKTNAAAVTRIAKRTVNRTETMTWYTQPCGTTASSDAWDGSYAAHTTAGATWADGAAWTHAAYTDNVGMWQVLTRNYVATTASTAEFRAEIYTATTESTLFTGDGVEAPIADNWCICDLGQVSIQPPWGQSGFYRVRQQYRRTAGSTDDINEDAIWLMPLDEFYHVAESTENSTSYKLLLSGLDNQVFIGSAAIDAYVYETCEPMGMPLTLEPNEDNYFFFCCDAANDVNNMMDEYDITVYHVPRYVNVRGSS